MPYLLNIENENIEEITFRRYSEKIDSNGENYLEMRFSYKEERAIVLRNGEKIAYGEGKNAPLNALKNALENAPNSLEKGILAEMLRENELVCAEPYYGFYLNYSYPKIGFYIVENNGRVKFYGKDLRRKKMSKILKNDFPAMPNDLAEEFHRSFKDLWKEEEETWEDFLFENNLPETTRLGDLVRKNIKKSEILRKQWEKYERQILQYVFRENDKEIPA